MTIAAKVNNMLVLPWQFVFVIFLCQTPPISPIPTNIINISRTLDDNVIERELDANSVVKDYLRTDFVFV